MKTVLMIAALIAVAAPVGAQERLADQLRKGIVEEETGKNLDKAIQAYQAIVARYDEDRKVAGTAMLRLADCYRKTGKREQAVTAYQRIVREFGDQAAIVETSRTQLAALGAAESRGRGGASAVEAARVRVAEARRHLEDVTKKYNPRHPEVVQAQDALKKAEAELKAIADRPREVAPERRERPREVAPEPRPRDISPERLREPVDINTSSLEETRIALDDLRTRLGRASDLYKRGQLDVSDLEALQTQMRRLEERYKQQQEQLMLKRELMAGVQKEIALLEKQIAAYEMKIQVGQASSDDNQLLQLRRDLIALQQKLAELRAGVMR